MQNYQYQNILINKKQLRQLLAWSFTNYDSMQACTLADELKYLGFKYASRSGISINIEDLKVPFVKQALVDEAYSKIESFEKACVKGKVSEIERFQKMIDTWNVTSHVLKTQLVHYFKNYDPLNSVYIMAFSGARGSLAQVRQLVAMRGLIADSSGQVLDLPIEKNFREGLTVTDYLMSSYGARKGIVDTALKTANSGYLTRRLIDVAQDILIREKDCLTKHSVRVTANKHNFKTVYDELIGRVLNKPIIDSKNQEIIAQVNVQITPKLIQKCKENNIKEFYIRSPFTCKLYRAICQKCYGWDLSNENLVDMGEAIGILAGQSIGEPGTQLTMRTFHTGGVVNSTIKTYQKINTPVSGVIKFSKLLKTVRIRTNQGEEVELVKNPFSLIIVSDKKSVTKINILPNTLLFSKNNQYLTKNAIIGQVLDKPRKKVREAIVNTNSGEVFLQRMIQNGNSVNKERLIWILSGQYYNIPKNSFINFYPDHKLLPGSYIFRTKITNHYSGRTAFINNKSALNQRLITIINNKYSLIQSKLQKLTKNVQFKNFLLSFNNAKYLLKIQTKNSELYLQLARNLQLGVLVNQNFQTLTGGTIYYDYLNHSILNKTITYMMPESLKRDYRYEEFIDVYRAYLYNRMEMKKDFKTGISYRTIIWFGEEAYRVNCEPAALLVNHGDFISEKFELIPGLFSKTSGIVKICQKSNLGHIISIKRGVVYEGNDFKDTLKKVYYPGEVILSTISVKNISLCDHILGKKHNQLLIQPIEIYESKYLDQNLISSKNNINQNSNLNFLNLESKTIYCYNSTQKIKGAKNLKLISNRLSLNFNKFLNPDINIKVKLCNSTKSIGFHIHEKIRLKNHIAPKIRYENIKSCFLIQSNQFIDRYTILGYLEATTSNILEIVKFKVKTKNTKEILLISNEDCFTVQKRKFPNKKLNDFIIDTNEIGKVIFENKNFLILQKTKSHLVTNCRETVSTNSLEYKTIPSNWIKPCLNTNKLISLNYQDMTKIWVKQEFNTNKLISLNSKKSKEEKSTTKIEFPQLFVTKKKNVYRSLIPHFSRKFSINHTDTSRFYQSDINQTLELEQSDQSEISRLLRKKKNEDKIIEVNGTVLIQIQSSKFVKNHYKKWTGINHQLVLVDVSSHPFAKSAKSVGLYSITENFFGQDHNQVFCTTFDFVRDNQVIGSVFVEKEVTQDIVQGLPKIERILEARKERLTITRIPANRKKELLVEKTSLNEKFDFTKLGTPIKENEKVNPHKLLHAYFNYYGLIKTFSCDRKKRMKYSRLIQNHEGSYKSFKKAQSYILRAVQAVYHSQGVYINDKHIEVIIKQMTTKVAITNEGKTPLLLHEVVDLYHIKYINQIVQAQEKQPASYVPFLLGITKSALNNPSFISAASFQETIRVLTNAAIEGRVDWLRGLKENIIIGHFIPSGTGSLNYQNCFKKNKPRKPLSTTNDESATV